MNIEAEAVRDAATSSSHGGSSNTHGKKNVQKQINEKNNGKQEQSPKGSTSELKGHCFFTTDDDQTTSQDHYRNTTEATDRHACRKME